MQEAVKTVIHDCAAASHEERANFGEIVGRLMGAGIERYHVDFVRRDTIYYLPDGAHEVVLLQTVSRDPAETFSAAGVAAAVKGAQSGALKYNAFCEHVLAAGCVGYVTSIAGKRVVYYGRTGDSHVEYFPGSAP
jgi:uncharacterized protein YbcV (DUF1398 family)